MHRCPLHSRNKGSDNGKLKQLALLIYYLHRIIIDVYRIGGVAWVKSKNVCLVTN